MSDKAIIRNGKTVGAAKYEKDGLQIVIEAESEIPDSSVYRLAVLEEGKIFPVGVMVPDGHSLKLRKRFTKLSLASQGITTEPNEFYLAKQDEIEKKLSEVIAESAAHLAPVIVPAAVKLAVSAVAPAPIAEMAGTLTKEIIDSIEPEHNPEVVPAPGVTDSHSVSLPVPEPALETFEQAPEPDTHTWHPAEDPRALLSDSGAFAVAGDVTGALMKTDNDYTYLGIPFDESSEFPLMPVFCLGTPEDIEGKTYIVFKIKSGIITL